MVLCYQGLFSLVWLIFVYPFRISGRAEELKLTEVDSDEEGGADAADELEDDEDDLQDADAEYIESLENGVCY